MTGRLLGWALVLLTLVGCGAGGDAPKPLRTPQMQQIAIEKSRVHLVELLAPAQKIVGGSWVDEDGGAEICATPDGKPGASFPLSRSGPAVPLEQQQAMVDAVSALWANAGYPGVQSLQLIKGAKGIALDYPQEFGTAPDGAHLTFAVSVGGSYVDAQTPCVEGDADAYNAAHSSDG